MLSCILCPARSRFFHANPRVPIMLFLRHSVMSMGTALSVAMLVFSCGGCGRASNDEVSVETSGLRPDDGPSNAESERSALGDFALTTSPSPEQEENRDAAEPSTEDLEDPYAIPSGGPEELVDFIGELGQRQPRGETRQQQMQDFGHMMDVRIESAERLMAEKDESFQLTGAGAKIDSLQALRSMGTKDADERLNSFYAELVESTSEKLSLMGKMASFMERSEKLLSQPQADLEAVTREIDEILTAEPLGELVLNATSQVIEMLIGVGANESAKQAIEIVSAAFQNSEDEGLVMQTEQLLDRIKQIRLQETLKAVVDGEEGVELELSEAVIDMFGNQFSDRLFSQLFRLGGDLEFSGRVSAAETIYEALSKAGGNSGDDTIQQQVEEQLAEPRKRLALVGQKFSIEGVTADGEPFDWSNYADKVVLVDFWATWCGPCLQEIPNMKEVYEKFHSAGFEIVGVNLDNSSKDLQSFLARESLPWTTVVGTGPDEMGFNNPIARRCGVSAIPFLVLVGRDGKVAGLHPRGPQLEPRVQEMLDGTGTTDSVGSGDDISDSGAEAPSDETISPEPVESDQPVGASDETAAPEVQN